MPTEKLGGDDRVPELFEKSRIVCAINTGCHGGLYSEKVSIGVFKGYMSPWAAGLTDGTAPSP